MNQCQAHCHDPPLSALWALALVSLMGHALKGGFGCGGLSRSLNRMYLVCKTGLSGKVTVLSTGASEMRLTAVSPSNLCGGPDWTELLA